MVSAVWGSLPAMKAASPVTMPRVAIRPISAPPASTLARRLASIFLVLVVAGCAVDETHEAGRGSATRAELLGDVAPDQLNIVLVTIDTLRADRLSTFGSRVRTPSLDRLAADGVLFVNASTTVPFTFPAHSSIMTGTYPPHHGVRENVGYYLGEESRTLAQMLGDAGWDTAGFVSAFVLDSRWGIGRGFDHYFDDFDLGSFQTANLGSVQRPGAETIAATRQWLDARDLESSRDRPFLLWLHLFDPHDPYTPPEPYRSQYPGRPYDAEVAYTDSLLGGFIEDLERRGLLANTAIVVTADHGEGLGDHGETFHGYFAYDSTVHVPLIFRLPGGVRPGLRIEEAVSHVDIVPTLLELTGNALPEPLQGRSLLASMAGVAPGGVADGPAPTVYAESFYPLLHYGWAPVRSLRSSSFKYIEAPEPELYDLASDPDETENLYPGPQGLGREMARSLRDLGESLEQGAAAVAEADLDEQTLAQLRALGYMAGPGKTDARSYDPSVPRPDPKEKIGLHRTIMLAQGRVSDGDEEEARRLLEQALKEDAELLDVHQLLGDLDLRADRPESAAEHFSRALALDDRHKSSLFGLATSHRRLGRTDEAILGYRRLLETAGQDSKATLAIADIEVERGDLPAAETVLLEATPPGAPALLFNRLGEVRALDGRLDEARKSFEEAVSVNPDLSQPHFNLAVLAEEEGDLAAARAHYEQSIERSPKHYQAQFNLARLMGRIGDPLRERELLELSIDSKPDFAIAHFFLGKSLMDSGELAQAEEMTRQGLELMDESELGWYVLADILGRSGRTDEAERALAKARSLARGG